MIANDIIKTVRFTLSDPLGSRWSDERLLSLLNDGLADIAKTTILFVDTLFIELIDSQTDYDLSAEAVKIIRIEYKDKELAQSSHAELDRKNPTWQTAEGTEILAYVLDKQREANFKVYPKLLNGNLDNINFGGNYGIITGITYSELQLNVAGTLGDLGEIGESGYLKVFYIRRHPKVADLADTIYLSDIAKEPLEHYICGRALRDNQDTQNRSLGNEEMKLYQSQLEAYSMEKAKSFSQASFVSPYRPLGE